MHARHVPVIDGRYWAGILCASIFGTNLGDFYAHHSGLGIGAGLAVLCVLFVLICVVEARDQAERELYYWTAIILVRTGATNIADFVDFHLRVPIWVLVPLLACAMAALAWGRAPSGAQADGGRLGRLTRYWGAMLCAGVLGTAGGDALAHGFGLPPAAIGLGLLLAGVLAALWRWLASRAAAYWSAVAVARTAGTCMGDWLAENKIFGLGLTHSTMLSGAVFVLLLVLWRSGRAPRVRA